MSVLYYRSESTKNEPVIIKPIPFASTVPALDLDLKNRDVFTQAPETRSLQGVDDTTGEVTDASFLADLLPLKILRILPSTESVNRDSSSNIELYGRTALLVVFNRAVIPLGGDWEQYSEDLSKAPFVLEGLPTIPGKFRWVTTSIARFDPDVDWPTDLEFTLKIKKDIKAYDGTPLSITKDSIFEQKYETPSLSMHISHVDSPKTRNLTNGLWSSRSEGELHEVPPDAKITLHFSHSINHDLVTQALQVYGKDSQRVVEFETTKCSDTCIFLTLKTKLDVDTTYTIHLPKGSQYHSYAGKLREAISEDFTGLVSFKFPFNGLHAAANRYHLWLRHGLDPSVTMEQFQQAITIYENDNKLPSSAWTVDRPHAGVLRITGTFKPVTSYKISVQKSSDILDGYGLSLQQAETSFKTVELPNYVSSPLGTLFENDFASDWEFLVRGHQQDCNGVILENINKNNIMKVLKDYYYYYYDYEEGTYGKTHPNYKSFPTDSKNTIVNFDNAVFGKSGSVYSRRACRWASKEIITKTDMAVVLTDESDTLIAWVTSMSTGLPIEGATVELYDAYTRDKQVKKISSNQTGDDGMALLATPSGNGQPLVVVSVGDSLLILRNVPSGYSSDRHPRYQASMFSDRSIYRLGETVHLKGYVNKYEMQTFSNVPDANLQNATISVSWDRNSHVSVTAKIDPELGSFNASLEIPYNALYAVTNINLQIQAPDHSSVYHSISVTIADPRLPTSTLDLQIEESTFKPQLNQIPITVETKSYTGNPIPDAEVTLRWNVNRYFQFTRHSPWEWWSRIRPWYTNFGSQEIFGVGLMPSGEQQVTVQPEEEDASTQKDQGTLLIKTDASGKVDHKFTLPAELLNRPVSDEDTINFEVEWIGPTREKLTQSVSKRVAHSDWKIGVQLPTEEVIPGYPFDVFVRLLDASKVDAIVEGQQVQLALYEWDGKTPLTRDLTNGAASLPFSVVGECEITSSSESLTNCSFTLPEARQYVLLTTTIDPSSYSVVTAVPVGKSPEDWKHSPLGHLPVSHMIWADKETYQIGDTAKVSFYVPYDGRVLVFWGNQLATQSMQQAVQTGKATFVCHHRQSNRFSIDIPVGKECYPDGCSVDIILSVPRDPNASLPLDVPASPLLDLGLPKEVRFSKVLNVYQHLPQVHVDVKPESDVARPGSTAQIEVSLTSEDNQPVSGEVTLWLVDKSIYDLQPSPPPNCTAQFMQSFKSKYRQITTSVETLSSEKALRNARQILLRRMGIDHWIIPSWDLQSPSELETSDEEFFVKHFGQLTKFPGYGYFHHRMFSRGHDAGVTMHSFGSAESVEMAPTLYSKKSVDTSSILLLDIAEPPQEQGPVIRSSTKFIMTPVFLASVKVDSTGNVKLPINLPDNIGTFKVFATAVSVDKQNDTATLRYGTGESELISRQPLSLQPSVPRITRLGDKFQAGVTVTITEPESDISQVKVTAQMKQGAESFIQLNNEATKTVSIKQTQPVEIVFDFEALRLGDALIQFTAELISENSKYSDGVEVTIPVLGLQEPVLVATSFSLDGKPATVASSQEGIKLPNAVPGSGNVTLEAGVGRLPSIMLLSEGIFNLVHHYETGSTLLSALAPKAALEAYNDGLEQHTRENLASEHLKAIATIAHYTSSDLGLTYFSPRNDDYPRYPSTYLNGIGLLQAKLMQKISDVVIPAELTAMWSSAFQAALRDEINRYGTTSMYWVSIFNYVYGPNAQLAGIEDKKNVVSFDNLVKNLDHHSCDASCKSIVALTIMDNSMSSQTQLLNNIIAYLESSIRVQGRTAYLTYNVGSGTAGSAGMMSNALGLWALSTYNYQTKASLNVLIEKVANYLGANSATRGFHATDSAFVALSLCNYDMLKGSTTPNVKLTVSSGQNVLLNEIFDSPSDPIVKKKHSWDILSDTVDFDAIGQGEVSIAIGLSFIPNDLFNTTIYRGIYVEKTIQLIDPFTHEAIGKHLTEVPTGTTVKVTIQLTTPDDLSNVVLIDPVPAGLEPIDPNISPAAGMGYQFGSYSGYACWDCWWFPWYSFPKQETMKDQVKFISSSLGAGTHTVSYEALAVTSGTFTLPPAKAFVLNQPELMGLSAAGKFIVKERL